MTRWLSPGVAAEFDIAVLPGDSDQVWSDLQAIGIDLAIQPAGGRRKRILIADMDSTMIDQECIDELADMAGFGPRVAQITTRAMNGELDFNAALTERVALLVNLPETVIAAGAGTRITLCRGRARAGGDDARALGPCCAGVGGFTGLHPAVARHPAVLTNIAQTRCWRRTAC